MLKKEIRTSPLLLLLVVIFVSFLMISNILANQMLKFFVFTIDAATLTFPVTYILSDVFSEVYGYKWSRRVSWMAVSMNLVLSLLILISINLPQPDWFEGSHFAIAVGSSLRIVIASALSYIVGDFVNDRIFMHMKKRKSGMHGFGLRAIMSSLGGEIVDTTLFVFLAFTFVVPFDEMGPMIFISVILKTSYELAILPFTAYLTRKVKAREGEWDER